MITKILKNYKKILSKTCGIFINPLIVYMKRFLNSYTIKKLKYLAGWNQ